MSYKWQRELPMSCPHGRWKSYDRENEDIVIKHSFVNPQSEEYESFIEPMETNTFSCPTEALERSGKLASEYKKLGWNLQYDMAKEQWGVHQLSKSGARTFFLSIEHRPKMGRF